MTRLEALLVTLEDAKRRLSERERRLSAMVSRTRGWDVSQPFLARRGLALRREAERDFRAELDRVAAVLAEGASVLSEAGTSRATLLVARRQLRYLQRTFDSGNPLLFRLLVDLERTLAERTAEPTAAPAP